MALLTTPDGMPEPEIPRDYLQATRPRSGPIHLHRELLTSWAWSLSAGPFRAMIQILLLAEDEPVEVRLKGKTFKVPRGSFVADRDWLADQCGVSWQTFRSHLRELEDREFAEIKDEKKGRVRIKIKNYAKYQEPCTQEPADLAPSRRTRRNQSAGNYLDGLVTEATLRGRRTGVLFRDAMSKESNLGDPGTRLGAIQRAASEAWADADLTLWIGLYAAKYREVYGALPSELLGARRKEITSQRVRVGAVLKVLRQWAGGDASAEALLFLYLRWIFRYEKARNQKFQEHASKGKSGNRSPITIDKVFSTRPDRGNQCLLDRWWVNRRLQIQRFSGRA